MSDTPAPPPKPIADIQSENAELVDRLLHDILTNGEEKVLMDGTKVRVKPSAAMLKAAMERGKQLGMQSPIGHGRAADALVEETARRMANGSLKYHGGAMPPVSMDPDAATG